MLENPYTTYFQALNKLNDAISQYKFQEENIRNDYPQTKNSKEKEELNKRLDKVFDKFTLKINESLRILDSTIKQMRETQENFSQVSLRKNGEFTSHILIGKNKIQTNLLDMKFRSIPKVHNFPFSNGFYTGDYESGEYFSNLLLIRLLSITPLNKLQITLIDTDSLGKHFKQIRRILHNDFIYNQRVLTYSKEIATALKDLADYMESLLQNQLAGYDNWQDFNSKNTKSPLPLKLLIIFGFDNEFSNESMLYLNRIIKFGIECGILPIIVANSNIESGNDRNKKELLDNFSKLLNIDVFLDSIIPNLESLELEALKEQMPSEYELSKFLDSINEFYSQDSHIKYDIFDLLDDNKFWSKTSIEGISVPIAKDMQEKILDFKIGFIDSEHHTLIGGRSGSGKSNFLHSLITSLSFYYSPDEIELFLLDYKEGVEFNAYTNPVLNHASLIAIHSDVQYGKSFLEYIIETKNERAELFKKFSVKDFKEYREKTGNKLARLLIIIDEFQVLLGEKRADEIQKLFVEILRKGRSYGIHLILSTQSLRGIMVDIGEMKGQIGNRIALLMGIEDSHNILSASNDVASTLKGKPFGILNYQGGVKEANILAKLPFVSESSIKNMLQKYQDSKTKNQNKVYDGEKVITQPEHFDRLKNTICLGVINNYREELLQIDFSKGKHLAICAKSKEGILESVKRNLESEKIYILDSIKTDTYFDSIESNSFVIIENYDNLKEYFINDYKDECKAFKEFIESSANKNINIIFFIQRVKQIFATSKIYDYIDNFVVLNIGAAVNTILSNENDALLNASLTHKNFYYNKFYGKIIEFKPYEIKNA